MDTTMESHVHEGMWTNWSRGQVMGSTLTLSRTKGNLLIAFTASFIGWVAIRFWHILCVACHRLYSTPDPRTTLHHQRQIILRNSSSPESGTFALLDLACAWRRDASRKNLLGVLPALCLAIFTVTAFTVAGGFSSTIASAVGDTVLLNSVNCGFSRSSLNSTEAAINTADGAESLNNAVNYAQQCYSSDPSGILDCSRFVQPKLSWETDTNAKCPFSPGMCRSNNRNIRLDTGPLGTDEALGLNAPQNEQSSLRYVLHCAPLVTDGYSSILNTSNTTLVRYNYGPVIASSAPGELVTVNYTFQQRSVASQYQFIWDTGAVNPAGVNFRLLMIPSTTVNGTPALEPALFAPFPNMTRSDGDVGILFLSGNGVVFQKRWDDDWYRGTVPSRNMWLDDIEGEWPSYIPEEAASPLGCVEQYQFCNLALPSESGCGPLASFNDAINGAAPYFNYTGDALDSGAPPLNNPEATRLWWLSMLINTNTMGLYDIIRFLTSKSLTSQASLFSGTQLSVPQEGLQWQLDVTNWFTTSLAAIQTTFVSTPLGPVSSAAAVLRSPPSDTVQQGMCNNQKVRSSKYTSFSMFGLCFTYALGGLVMLVSTFIESVLRCLYKRYRYQGYQQLEWTTSNSLQLHRLAHEELGYGEWSKCTHKVPITKAETTLGNLDTTDQHRPVIMKPTIEINESKRTDTGTQSSENQQESVAEENAENTGDSENETSVRDAAMISEHVVSIRDEDMIS